MTPPKAPPAPPSAKELVGAPTKTPVAAVKAAPKTAKEELTDMVKDIRRIGAAVPTPNVTDSKMHGAQLGEIADKLEKLANG